MSDFKLVLRAAKPLTSIVGALVVIAVLFIQMEYSLAQSVLYSMPIALVIMVAFLVNDIYDQEKDSHSDFDKPIAKGLLDLGVARNYAVGFALSAISLELLLNGYRHMALFLMALLGAVLYSPFALKVPTMKGLATTVLSLLPVAYADALVGFSIDQFVFLSVGLFIFGREILLDTKHIAVDSAAGLRTIPAYIGLETSRIFAWSFMFAGIVVFLANVTNTYAVGFSLAGFLCLIAALLLDVRNKVPTAGLTILVMVLATLAIPFTI
jgi:4-hydroxybenzoate polyprenyltransferase